MHTANKLKINVFSYGIALCAAFVAGAIPAGLIFGVDPYEIFRNTSRTTKIQEIAEKAHYPLWKLAKYQEGRFDTIILGDSRARALKDKYWHELGMNKALNLAYGGGTIPEIYSTFKLIEHDNKIESLVIGIQLRSFDEDHKAGMNRVPEAKFIANNPIEYLKNWSVFKTAWNMMTIEEKATFDSFDSFVKTFSMRAEASDFSTKSGITPQPQLDADCYTCDLEDEINRLSISDRYNIFKNPSFHRQEESNISIAAPTQNNWSDISHLYATSNTLQPLPQKMIRQVTKNAKSDWATFDFSQTYWSHLEEISRWANDHNKNLVFVIPPTIEDMQRTISVHGLEQLNHKFRIELAKLGTVIDFDFSNNLTRQISNFSDAYHFNSKIAKQIVGEITAMITTNGQIKGLALKRSEDIQCQRTAINSDNIKISDNIYLENRTNCRIWRKA